MNEQPYWPDKKPRSPTIFGQALPGALLDLPTEILILILRYLPVPDVLRIQPVSNSILTPRDHLELVPIFHTRPAGFWTLLFAHGLCCSTRLNYTVLGDAI